MEERCFTRLASQRPVKRITALANFIKIDMGDVRSRAGRLAAHDETTAERTGVPAVGIALDGKRIGLARQEPFPTGAGARVFWSGDGSRPDPRSAGRERMIFGARSTPHSN